MGLHSDVKAYVKKHFPEVLTSELPGDVKTQVVDLMYLLYRFPAGDHSWVSDLVWYYWNPIKDFFESGGEKYVACFDVPDHVTNAKKEEQKKRRKLYEDLEIREIDPETNTLPRPWHAALADFGARTGIISFVAEALQKKFERAKYPNKTLVLHVTERPLWLKTNDEGECFESREEAPLRLGEADASLGYWCSRFRGEPVVARALDSDQMCISMLSASRTPRTAPLYLWLASSSGTFSERREGNVYVGSERRDLIDIRALNAACTARNATVEDFCFWMIIQQTDFVKKVFYAVNVEDGMKSFWQTQRENAAPIVKINASSSAFDECAFDRASGAVFLNAKTKRVKFVDDAKTEIRRAWWNVLYWTLACEGKTLDCVGYGWDEKGDKVSVAARFDPVTF